MQNIPYNYIPREFFAADERDFLDNSISQSNNNYYYILTSIMHFINYQKESLKERL